MFSSTITLVFAALAAISLIEAKPRYRRQAAVQEVNKLNLATPGSSAPVTNNGDGTFGVVGIKFGAQDVAIQVACLDDVRTCKTKFPGASDNDCLQLRFACEIGNGLAGKKGLLNAGKVTADTQPDTDPAVVANNNGQKLISGGQPARIGRILNDQIKDNSDGTYTTDDLTSFSRGLVLQMGCLFDEKDCNTPPVLENCTVRRIACEDKNGLTALEVVLNDTPGPAAPAAPAAPPA